MFYSLTFTNIEPVSPLYFSKDLRLYSVGTVEQKVKNTWIDWHLVPTKRPSIKIPEVQKKRVEVPGLNGLLDYSQSLTGYPIYTNRSDSIEFMVMNDYDRWENIYADICSFLHGKRMYMAFEEDPNHYYAGTFTVSNYESEKDNSKIVIEYDLEPFRYDYSTTAFNWDFFDFNYGVLKGIRYNDRAKNFRINSASYATMFNYTTEGLNPPFNGWGVDSPYKWSNFVDEETFAELFEDDTYPDYDELVNEKPDTPDWGYFTQIPVVPSFDITFDSTEPEPEHYLKIHFVNTELQIDVVKEIYQNGTYIFPEMIISQLKYLGLYEKSIDLQTGELVTSVPAFTYPQNAMVIEALGKATVSVNFKTGRL